MRKDLNYIMDLERSIGSGYVTYWKTNRLGYTRDIKEAGVYSDEVADLLVAEDFDNRTVKIPVSVVKNINKNI